MLEHAKTEEGERKPLGKFMALAEAQKVIKALWTAIGNYKLYPREHRIVANSKTVLWAAIEDLLSKTEEASIERLEDEFSFDGLPIFGAAEQSRLLGKWFEKLDIEVIKLSRGVTKLEISHFTDILGNALKSSEEKVNLEREFQRRDIRHIRLAKLEARGPSEEKEKIKDLRQIYNSAVSVVKKLMDDARKGKALDIKETQSIVINLVDRMLKQKDNALALSMIKTYDEYLFVHSVNVSILTLGLAESFISDEKLLVDLGKAAMMHDIGKTIIPSKILNKPGDLLDEEWKIIRRHPVEGMKIMENSENNSNLASLIAFEHHLRYDGSGYPPQRFRKDINPYSMMVSIADCYDALTTDRPYRKVMTPEVSLNLMAKVAGAHFEPRFLRSFVLTMGIYPIGTIVRLSTGEIGVVKARNPSDVTRPKVRIIVDADDGKIREERFVELTERNPSTGQYLRSIKSIIPYTSIPGLDMIDYLV